MRSLFVVGALHLDVVVTAPRLPQIDETVVGSQVSYQFGGKGGNQAVSAARHGADVAFAGRIGSDEFGQILRGVLIENGIDIRQLQRDDGPSGMSTAIVNAQGDYGAVIVSASNLNIDAERIDLDAKSGIVLLQNEVPPEVNLAIARKGKAAGCEIWLNAAPARSLHGDFASLIDVMIVNRIEAEQCGIAPGEPWDHPAQVIVTLGADGLVCGGQQQKGFDVSVVSTHGAGDAFVGALAARCLAGDDMMAALHYAQAAAALHVSSDMAARAEITPPDVEVLLRSQPSR